MQYKLDGWSQSGQSNGVKELFATNASMYILMDKIKYFFLLNSDIKLTEEKVKKSWMVVDAKTLRKDVVQRETVYCLNDDDETEIQKEDVIQGMLSVM